MVVFFSMLNVAGINTQIIHLGNGNDTMKRRKFLKKLANELVHEHVQGRKTVPADLKAKFLKRKAEFHNEPLQDEPTTSEPAKKTMQTVFRGEKNKNYAFCMFCMYTAYLPSTCTICMYNLQGIPTR